MKPYRLALLTTLLIVGIFIGYVHQMAPSPIFNMLVKDYAIYSGDGLTDYARLNLPVSIMFLFIIIASIAGAPLELRIGPRNLYIVVLTLLTAGTLMNYAARDFTLYTLGRAVMGAGFGLGLPFIGSAIMRWYSPRQREIMNSINGMFPFVGTVISFGVMVPLTHAFGGSWRQALGIWGFGCSVVLILWILLVRELPLQPGEPGTDTQDEGTLQLYGGLWKRKEIKLLSVAFTCDFFCYAYIAAILPTYLGMAGNISEAQAGLLAAIAFPAMGILGALIGGAWLTTGGKRKPPFISGQILKFLGICVASLGAGISIWMIVAGMVLFGLGNSMWMPAMYNIITDLDEMTPTRAGASFAFTSAFGFVAGVISPYLGGLLTNVLIASSGISDPVLAQMHGLRWSLFAFGFLNLICLACALSIRETGKGKKAFNAGGSIPEIETV
jgi:MFS family permease